MDAHNNPRATPPGRRLGVERLGSGWAMIDVPAAMRVSAKMVHT